MSIKDYIIRILKDGNCLGPLVVTAVGLIFHLIATNPPPAFDSLSLITGTINRVRVVHPPRDETRLVINIETGQSHETIFVRHYDWLLDHAPLLSTLKSGEIIQVRFSRDFLGRDFLESWQISRNNEAIFNYRDMVAAEHGVHDVDFRFGTILVVWGIVVFILLSFFKKKEIDNFADDPDLDSVQYSWISSTFGMIVFFSVSCVLLEIWYHQYIIGDVIWWILCIALVGIILSLRNLYLLALRIPHIIYLENDHIQICYVLREGISCPYSNIDSIDMRKTFWQSSYATIYLQSKIKVLLGLRNTTNFDLLVDTVKKKHPQCLIQGS